MDELEIRILDKTGENGAVVEEKAVENADPVAGRQELSRQHAADIAGTAQPRECCDFRFLGSRATPYSTVNGTGLP